MLSETESEKAIRGTLSDADLKQIHKWRCKRPDCEDCGTQFSTKVDIFRHLCYHVEMGNFSGIGDRMGTHELVLTRDQFEQLRVALVERFGAERMSKRKRHADQKSVDSEAEFQRELGATLADTKSGDGNKELTTSSTRRSNSRKRSKSGTSDCSALSVLTTKEHSDKTKDKRKKTTSKKLKKKKSSAAAKSATRSKSLSRSVSRTRDRRSSKSRTSAFVASSSVSKVRSAKPGEATRKRAEEYRRRKEERDEERKSLASQTASRSRAPRKKHRSHSRSRTRSSSRTRHRSGRSQTKSSGRTPARGRNRIPLRAKRSETRDSRATAHRPRDSRRHRRSRSRSASRSRSRSRGRRSHRRHSPSGCRGRSHRRSHSRSRSRSRRRDSRYGGHSHGGNGGSHYGHSQSRSKTGHSHSRSSTGRHAAGGRHRRDAQRRLEAEKQHKRRRDSPEGRDARNVRIVRKLEEDLRRLRAEVQSQASVDPTIKELLQAVAGVSKTAEDQMKLLAKLAIGGKNSESDPLAEFLAAKSGDDTWLFTGKKDGILIKNPLSSDISADAAVARVFNTDNVGFWAAFADLKKHHSQLPDRWRKILEDRRNPREMRQFPELKMDCISKASKAGLVASMTAQMAAVAATRKEESRKMGLAMLHANRLMQHAFAAIWIALMDPLPEGIQLAKDQLVRNRHDAAKFCVYYPGVDDCSAKTAARYFSKPLSHYKDLEKKRKEAAAARNNRQQKQQQQGVFRRRDEFRGPPPAHIPTHRPVHGQHSGNMAGPPPFRR